MNPDVSILGSNVVSVGCNLVMNGVVNPSTSTITWTTDTGLSGKLAPKYAAYVAVANDGNNTWMIVGADQTTSNTKSWIRTGNTGGWTSVVDTTILFMKETTDWPNSPALIYSSPNFILAGDVEASSGYSGGFVRIQYSPSSNLGRWTNAEQTGASIGLGHRITRFATSNATVVAVGEGNSGAPIAKSVNGGQTWTQVGITGPAFLNYNIDTNLGPVITDIFYGNGTWVMCGTTSRVGDGFIVYSSDLSNWTSYTNSEITGINWVSLTFNGNAWSFAGYKTIDNLYQSALLSLNASAWPGQPYSIAYGSIATDIQGVAVGKLLSYSNAVANPTGTAVVPQLTGGLTFTSPSTPNITLFQYVPYSIPVQVTGTSSFIYYYAMDLPVGFTFTLDSDGVAAALTGISPSNNTSSLVTVYAKTASGSPVRTTFTLNTILPFFVNPQSGAGAYTSLLRNDVEANAAQNARDNKTFPQVDSLAGPLMGPRAPDVVTAPNCMLKLCKKPCPTCHTMM